MGKIHKIESEEWMRAGAKVDVDRFFKKQGLDTQKKLDIFELVRFVGLELCFFNFKDMNLLGCISSSTNKLIINDVLMDYADLAVKTIAYLLGVCFYHQEVEGKYRKVFPEDREKELNAIKDYFKKYENEEIMCLNHPNHDVYIESLYESREADPELYYFYKELLSRDVELEEEYYM